MRDWKDFDALDKCIAVLLLAGAGAIGAGVLWLSAFIVGCM